MVEGVVLHGLWLKSENFRFKSAEERVGLESEIFRLEVKLQEVPSEGAKDTEATAEVSFAPYILNYLSGDHSEEN
jgi:hypothetical protein